MFLLRVLFTTPLYFIFFCSFLQTGELCSQTADSTLLYGEKLGTDSEHSPPLNYKYVIVNNILILGNKVTKRHIILRELLFQPEDSIQVLDLKNKIKTSRENLLNTSLFNFVTIDTVSYAPFKINFIITVAERWYTWPAPIFEVQERNFNIWWQTKNLERANYGFYLNRTNFRGRKEDLSFYFQFGYTEKYGLTYKIPYIAKSNTSGAGISFSYSRNREVAYMSFDNHQLFFKDPNQKIRQEFTSKMHYNYRAGARTNHLIEAKYVQAKINDTINDYTINYFYKNDTEIKFLLLDYFLRFDQRNSRIFPLKGYYLEFEATKIGLGLLTSEKTNALNLLISAKEYIRISNRLYQSGGLRVKYSPTKNQPYYIQRGLGWGEYVRGYEYYVIDGQSYGVAKLGLKYEIIKPKIKKVPFIPFEKFNTFHFSLYAGIFGDVGYVQDYQYSLVNPLANSLLYGYGAGLEYVTYYDIVIRCEYSFNKRLEHGFFVSFSAGI